MALTADLTTPDGVNHPQAYAAVYPLCLQTVTDDFQVNLVLHCWHDKAAKETGMQEIHGYPRPLLLTGQEAQAEVVTALSKLSSVEWGEDAQENASKAEQAILRCIEEAVCKVFTDFSLLDEQ